MESLAKDLIGSVLKIARAIDLLRDTIFDSEREKQEKKRRDELREGSVDVEYRVKKEENDKR